MFMATGIVKFFNRKNNFGFITPDEGGKDIFFHGANLIGNINDGEAVEYDLGVNSLKNDYEAFKVKKVITYSSSKSSEYLRKQYITKGYVCSNCGKKETSDLYMATFFPSTCRSCKTSLLWDDCFWNCPNCGTINEPEVKKCQCGFDYTIHGL